MNWEELMQLGKIFTNIIKDKDANNKYGFMSEWWFSWGWSVGGDCIQLGFTDGVNSKEGSVSSDKYGLSLNDQNKNILVTQDTTVNGTSYSAGDILSYKDRTYVEDNASESAIKALLDDNTLYDELPSMREAFETFLNISMENETRVAPKPSELSGTDYNSMFGNEQIAMLAQTTVASYTLGDYAEGFFKWDVAPMPQYRVYDTDGTLKEVNGTPVTGKKATHSTLSCYAISSYSKNKEEAWAFIEYLLSGDVQSMSAEFGSAMGVPALKSIATSEEWLNSTANHSANNKAALLAASDYSRAGDWSYLETDQWINQWQGRKGLNTVGKIVAWVLAIFLLAGVAGVIVYFVAKEEGADYFVEYNGEKYLGNAEGGKLNITSGEEYRFEVKSLTGENVNFDVKVTSNPANNFEYTVDGKLCPEG